MQNQSPDGFLEKVKNRFVSWYKSLPWYLQLVVLIAVAVLVYVISPLDAAPGGADDIAVIFVGFGLEVLTLIFAIFVTSIQTVFGAIWQGFLTLVGARKIRK